MDKTKIEQEIDEAVEELRLYAVNTGELYPALQRVEASMRERLAQEPEVSPDHFIDSWMRWCEEARLSYRREIGANEYQFTRTVVKRLARVMATDTLAELRIQQIPAGQEVRDGNA